MPESTQIGSISLLHGDARAVGPEGARPLTQGSPVYQGETIETSHGAALEITFADGMKLSQGSDSRVELDTYVYDPENESGEILFNLVEGTFRSVTGKVVDMNPEGFNLKSPLATIGIRGTTTGHRIPGDGGQEEHLVITYDGKPVVVMSALGGPPQVLTTSGLKVLASSEGLSDYYRASPEEIARFEQLSTESLREGVPDDQGGDDDQGDNGDDAGDDQGQGDDGPAPIISVMPVPEGWELIPPPPEPQPQPQPQPEPQPDPGQQAGTEPVVVAGGDDDDNDNDDTGGDDTTQTVLDLSDFWQGMLTIDMVSNEYYPTEMANNTTSFPSTVTTVIGSETQNNSIYGDENANDITGGHGDDFIESACGNDIIRMGAYLTSCDSINGGDDTDTLAFSYTGADQMDQVSGIEVVQVSNSNPTETVSLVLTDNIMGSASDYMTFDFSGLEAGAKVNINGSAETQGNFVLSGTDQGDTLKGGGGNDLISGGGGGDDLQGNGGNDTLSYADCTDTNGVDVSLGDTLGGAPTQDTFGGFENVIGSAYGDILTGTTGANILMGLAGNDTLEGHKGSDTITTGSGSDSVYYGSIDEATWGGATDTVTDFSHANDSFEFYGTDFGGFTNGTWDGSRFFTSSASVTGTDAAFIWEGGVLSYDADGTATDYSAQTVAAVTVTDGDLDHTDITFS